MTVKEQNCGALYADKQASESEANVDPYEIIAGLRETVQDQPLAAEGLTSYRYCGRYGWIMIGAKDDADALNEAACSTNEPVSKRNLQVWNGRKYQRVKP